MHELRKNMSVHWLELTKYIVNDRILIDVLHKNSIFFKAQFCGTQAVNKLYFYGGRILC